MSPRLFNVEMIVCHVEEINIKQIQFGVSFLSQPNPYSPLHSHASSFASRKALLNTFRMNGPRLRCI